MGLGCRNVALIACGFLLIFEILSSIAVGKNNQGYNSQENDFLVKVPVHRMKRSVIASEYASESDSSGSASDLYFQQTTIGNKQNPQKYATFQANIWDRSSINNQKTKSSDSFYTYTSPIGTRLKFQWKDLNIEEYDHDYITAYSGEFDPSIGNVEEALEDLRKDSIKEVKSEDLNFMFSTKPLSGALDAGSLKGRTFSADGNKMTVHFRHSSQSGPHDGHFLGEVKYDEFIGGSGGGGGGGGIAPRNTGPRDLSKPSIRKSFSICDNDNSNTDQIETITSDGGYISSHHSFMSSKIFNENPATHCRKIIKSANGNNLQIKFTELKLKDMDGINRKKCDPTEGHIKFIDRTDPNAEAVLYCHHDSRDGILDLIFGDEVEIDYMVGAWSTIGFSLEYLAKDDKNENDGDEDDKSRSDKEISENENESEEQNLSARSVQVPEDQITEQMIEDQDQPLPKQKNSKKFTDLLVKTTMISVGLILIVILISAAFIACSKSAEQQDVIDDLLKKVETLERETLQKSKNETESAPIICNSSSTCDDIIDENRNFRSTSKCVIDMGTDRSTAYDNLVDEIRVVDK